MKGKIRLQPTMERSQSEESLSDTYLQFPDMKPVEHVKLCPRYTAVLSRSEMDGIGIEEIDTLQTELETLLADVAKRMRHLESELSNLSGIQDKLTTPQKGKGKNMESGKRVGKFTDDKPSKRLKETSGKAAIAIIPSRTSKGKGQQTPKLESILPVDSPKPQQPKELPKVPKNDAPNRFWALVEPYCADLAIEDLRVLEDLLRAHEDESMELQKIPNLGKHYSIKWAQEDLLEEQREGTKPKGSIGKPPLVSDAFALLKKASNDDRKSSMYPTPLDLHGEEDASPFGPLTQRLVSALIEENIMMPLEDATMETDTSEAATMSPKSLAKQLNIGNTAQLERRIRKELEEQGILEVDRPDDNPEDEILMELKRKQRELSVLSQENHRQTKLLYKLAKDEMTRQELKRKMAVADADVLECLRKFQAAKQKKRPTSKKERDMANKALREREGIIQQLEDLG